MLRFLNTILSGRSILSCNVTYSQVSGTRTRRLCGGYYFALRRAESCLVLFSQNLSGHTKKVLSKSFKFIGNDAVRLSGSVEGKAESAVLVGMV